MGWVSSQATLKSWRSGLIRMPRRLKQKEKSSDQADWIGTRKEACLWEEVENITEDEN